MNLTRELSYDAGIDAVREMLCDPVYQDKVATATGAGLGKEYAAGQAWLRGER